MMQKSFFTTPEGAKMGYLLYRQGEKQPGAPLLIYLHGGDGRGDDPDLFYRIPCLAQFIEDGSAVIPEGAVVLSPQCAEGSNWAKEGAVLKALIDQLIETEELDPKRISLTGVSLGGMGTFTMGVAYPAFFSCLMPVCASVDPATCAVLTDVPVRIFHGTEDHGMGFSVKEAHEVIKAAGGSSELNMLEGHGHEIRWIYQDRSMGLTEWMLARKRA
ncbi:MAG: hypothetical protein E7330_02400 [Clostridiales bacterium]|nr:hypothetical protein [Clostridiales bacterium]